MPRIYCAVVQPREGGTPVEAITTVHLDDYEALLAENERLREALRDPTNYHWGPGGRDCECEDCAAKRTLAGPPTEVEST